MKFSLNQIKTEMPLLIENNTFYLKGSGHRIKLGQYISKEFSLFLGMLWGDGWIINREKALLKYQWRIGFVEDDNGIINKYISLCKKLFNINARICDRKTKIEIYFNSKIVYEILNRIFDFPDGEKKDRLRIPKQIINSKLLLKSFLKGIFSTDGKFVVYNHYPRIGIDSATYKLISDISETMMLFNLSPTTYTWNRKNGNKLFGLYLNGYEQILNFNDNIGFLGEKDNKLKAFIKAPK